jgi:predicted transglutaminase-like cysteine proteinase
VVMLILTISANLGHPQQAAANELDALFGYAEIAQNNLEAFPQWLKVLNEAETPQNANEVCTRSSQTTECHINTWWNFLQGLRGKTPRAQLDAVNRFVNEQNYVGDETNYGREDYWAQPGQLMANGGDCEDFAIMKFFSLRKLGWPAESLRLVVVQDTKLRKQHAVLAVESDQDVLILDNQNQRIQSQNSIPHYAPVVSMSDDQWWLHMPESQLVATTR